MRDLKAAAILLHVDERTAAVHVEVAHAAGLLAVGYGGDGETRWLPTDSFDLWTAAPMAERWTRLALAWLETPRMVGLLGGRDRSAAGAGHARQAAQRARAGPGGRLAARDAAHRTDRARAAGPR